MTKPKKHAAKKRTNSSKHQSAMESPRALELIGSLRQDWLSMSVRDRGMRLQVLVDLGCSTRGLEKELGQSATSIRRHLATGDKPNKGVTLKVANPAQRTSKLEDAMNPQIAFKTARPAVNREPSAEGRKFGVMVARASAKPAQGVDRVRDALESQAAFRATAERRAKAASNRSQQQSVVDVPKTGALTDVVTGDDLKTAADQLHRPHDAQAAGRALVEKWEMEKMRRQQKLDSLRTPFKRSHHSDASQIGRQGRPVDEPPKRP